jgi:uncharacterized SAM-binding protein YcdF (DUF218 family)
MQSATEPSSMSFQKEKQCIWDYMLMNHELPVVADAIMVLGSYDTNVGRYAAELYNRGLAPILICSGSGSVNHDNPAYADFVGSTEAEVFANIALKAGVPKESIIIESKSQNTGQNYEFTKELLANKGITELKVVIAVQKQFMERRTYATGKVWWPDVDIRVTSPPMNMTDYPTSNPSVNVDEHWVHAMIGDLQRIKEYPAKGFQIEQDIPEHVWNAWETLVTEGYTNCVLK